MENKNIPGQETKHFMLSFLGIHSKGMILMNLLLTAFGAAIGTYFIGFVNTIKIHSAELIVLLVILILDWITGTMVAIREKKFQTRKALRSPMQIIGYIMVAICVYEIQKVYPLLGFLEAAVLLPIVVFNFISILKNMALLGWIKKGLLVKILENIDSHKDKIFKKADQAEEQTEEKNSTQP